MAKKKRKKSKGKGKKQPSNSWNGELHNGILVRSTGSWYKVRLESGEVIDCRLRGKFKIQGIKSTNPVAVGDHVKVSLEEDEENTGVIREILPRKNFLIRKSVNLSKRVHILCANIDQAVILFTLTQPHTVLGYVDRLLITCEAYDIPAVIVFNKTDLVFEDGLDEKLSQFVETYEKLGYPVLQLCADDPQYQEPVTDLLRDKVSFVVGKSGAGKTTLINLADEHLNLKTSLVSAAWGEGRHTTTYAEMFDLSFGGSIIDSPGFKEMELVRFEKDELSGYFREFIEFMQECRFNDCSHTIEPGCAVREAVENGQIAETRFGTYLAMYDGIEEILGSDKE